VERTATLSTPSETGARKKGGHLRMEKGKLLGNEGVLRGGRKNFRDAPKNREGKKGTTNPGGVVK